MDLTRHAKSSSQRDEDLDRIADDPNAERGEEKGKQDAQCHVIGRAAARRRARSKHTSEHQDGAHQGDNEQQIGARLQNIDERNLTWRIGLGLQHAGRESQGRVFQRSYKRLAFT
jgi:hypothetical protein